jgi:hypothetical protein
VRGIGEPAVRQRVAEQEVAIFVMNSWNGDGKLPENGKPYDDDSEE